MGYFIVPDWVLNARIDAGAIRCYIYLSNISTGGKCQIHHSKLAEVLGVGKRQAQRYIYKLIDAGLIERRRPKVVGRFNQANIYILASANIHELAPVK